MVVKDRRAESMGSSPTYFVVLQTGLALHLDAGKLIPEQLGLEEFLSTKTIGILGNQRYFV